MGSNVQKMREALEAWLKACDDFIAKPRSGKWPKNPCGTVVIPPIKAARLVEMTKEARSLPLRNCNVGTAQEQEKRFAKFCDAHKWVDDEGVNACSAYCPLYKTTECALHWAQMPYEETEGGAK